MLFVTKSHIGSITLQLVSPLKEFKFSLNADTKIDLFDFDAPSVSAAILSGHQVLSFHFVDNF